MIRTIDACRHKSICKMTTEQRGDAPHLLLNVNLHLMKHRA